MSFSDGSRRRETLAVRIARGVAPSILAVKARLTARLDDGETVEAVKLACHFNVICEGAAFIAIDEAQQVPVARVVLEQPSQAPELAARDQVSFLYTRNCTSSPLADFRLPSSRLGGEEPPPPVGLADLIIDYSREEENPDLSGMPGHIENAARLLLEIASRVTCFYGDDWMELMKDHLIPWACEDDWRGRGAKLERLIMWLEGISRTGGSTGEIVKQFEVLLPSLDGEALKQTRMFIENFKKQNTPPRP